MRLEWVTFTTAKSGNHPDENEDACFPLSGNPGDVKEFRCALTDGATSTSFSKKWARLLAETSVKDLNSTHQSLRPILQRGQIQWSDHLKELDLPWHALEKSQQGAFSTLLWFKAVQTGYSNKTLGMWQALAVGDTCFCQLRNNKIQASFPLQTSSELSNNPFLLSSIESRNETLWKNNILRKAQGAFEGGDEFLFMTDALAGWFLKELEEGCNPMDALKEILADSSGGNNKFESLVRLLRGSGSLKNDDSTLGYLKIQRKGGHMQERGWN
ncbi:MAG: protein phosphatase 2C domain-containing protein [Anaerolineaceae bacterium]